MLEILGLKKLQTEIFFFLNLCDLKLSKKFLGLKSYIQYPRFYWVQCLTIPYF